MSNKWPNWKNNEYENNQFKYVDDGDVKVNIRELQTLLNFIIQTPFAQTLLDYKVHGKIREMCEKYNTAALDREKELRQEWVNKYVKKAFEDDEKDRDLPDRWEGGP